MSELSTMVTFKCGHPRTEENSKSNGYSPNGAVKTRCRECFNKKESKRLQKRTHIIRQRVVISDLAGIAELASFGRVTKQVVINWRTRYAAFPKPIRTLDMGPLYRISDFVMFLRSRK